MQQLDKNVRFMFLRSVGKKSVKGTPIGCLLMHRNKETGEVSYSTAVTAPADSFDKKLGLKIALGRLLKKPNKLVSSGKTFHEITTDVMNHLEQNGSHLAKEAAKNWLNISLDKDKENTK